MEKPGLPRPRKTMGRRLVKVPSPVLAEELEGSPSGISEQTAPGTCQPNPEPFPARHEVMITAFPVIIPGETLEEKIFRLGKIHCTFSKHPTALEDNGEHVTIALFPRAEGATSPISPQHVRVVESKDSPGLWLVPQPLPYIQGPEELEHQVAVARYAEDARHSPWSGQWNQGNLT